MKNMLLLCILMLVIQAGYAQQTECGTDEYLQMQLRRNPGMQAQINDFMTQVATWLREHPADPDLHGIPVTIPVVFHVLYKNAGENLAKATIEEQVRITNAQLARRASNYNTTPAPFKQVAADARIQIALARRDPSGRPTDGIDRQSVTKAVYTQELNDAKQSSQGGVDAWDPSRYLNVWVCDITASWLAAGWVLNGYAVFPYETTTPPNLHGVVMNYRNIGSGESRGGATFTHELGHFLGLEHIWGNANCGDDLVGDTPTQAALNTGCPTFPKVSACTGNGANGDMFYNYMDYTNCQTMFTQGQARRMWGFLNFASARSSLLRSDALMPAAARPPYVVDFIPEYSNLPSWKASLAMVHSYVVQQCVTIAEVNRLIGAGSSARGSHLSSVPADLANAVFGLGLQADEVLACYTPAGFNDNVMNRGPVALVEVSGSSIFGIIVTGMQVSGSTATVSINDPLDIGPQTFLSRVLRAQSGHEKVVDYTDLMTGMETAVRNGKRLYFVRPISSI
ncbi:MAG: hypothetical protein IPL65_11050 [Lewinellaceae bacterium]|nr:hypothetical protein [Lewinellaceae bacterium]